MPSYVKPHLSFEAQVELLESRGMAIDDPAAAAELLSVIGYYRLSGYWYPYRRQLGSRQRADQFVPGTKFSTVVRLYDADRRLKLHVLDAIERVEIALRVMIGFTLSAVSETVMPWATGCEYSTTSATSALIIHGCGIDTSSTRSHHAHSRPFRSFVS